MSNKDFSKHVPANTEMVTLRTEVRVDFVKRRRHSLAIERDYIFFCHEPAGPYCKQDMDEYVHKDYVEKLKALGYIFGSDPSRPIKKVEEVRDLPGTVGSPKGVSTSNTESGKQVKQV